MSYDRTFGADRHDLGSRLSHLAAEASHRNLASRAIDALRRLLGQAPEQRGGGAALSRLAGGPSRDPGSGTLS